MYGPFPAFGFDDTGQLDVATGTLYWVVSVTNTSGSNYSVVVSYIGRDLVLQSVTCVCLNCGTGAPHGPLLRDPSTGNLFIYVESGYAYGTWYEFTSTGVAVANLGGLGIASGPLRARQDAILDGAGNLLYLADVLGTPAVTVITLSPFQIQGSAPLTYTGSSRIAIGAANSIWVISTDGVNGAIDLVTPNTPPAPPTITSFSLGLGTAHVAYTIEYDAADDTLLFWWNDLLIKWSCTTHIVVRSISLGYFGSGPLQGSLVNSGIGFYDPATLLLSPITAVGCNPGLPGFNNGVSFKHLFDNAGQVIWLQANDTNVYGVILCPHLGLTCASGSATLGVPYSSSLVASNGTPPYSFSIIHGSLPPGLTLNANSGVISGTPILVGTFPYTAQVLDSVGNTATASCRITVVAPAPSGGGAGAGAPNRIYVLDYRELDTASDIAERPPIKISLNSKMTSSDHCRKWTRWNVAANCGAMYLSQKYSAGPFPAGTGGSLLQTCLAGTSGASPLTTSEGFGFQIPSGSIILGIQVSFYRSVANELLLAHTQQIFMEKANAPAGTAKGSVVLWQQGRMQETYGGPTDLWGTSWSAGDINDPGFGFAMAALYSNRGGQTYTLEADSSEITVFYLGTAGTVEFVIGGGNGQAPGVASGFANAYLLDPAKYTDDDYGMIVPYYLTYFFVNHEAEMGLGLGLGRKLFKRYAAFVSGVGKLLLTPYANTVANPYPSPPLFPLNQDALVDSADGLNVSAERCAVKIQSVPLEDETDNAFNLQKFILTMKKEPVSPVRGGAV